MEIMKWLEGDKGQAPLGKTEDKGRDLATGGGGRNGQNCLSP